VNSGLLGERFARRGVLLFLLLLYGGGGGGLP